MVKRSKKELKGGEKASRKCPSCHSNRIWKDGLRKTKNNHVQRYICRDCECRFSESSILSIDANNNGRRQVCAVLTDAKNLANREPLENGLAGATGQNRVTDIQGKIVEYLWHLKKKGLQESSIGHYGQKLRQLVGLGVDLLVPEEVKTCLANNNRWSECTKAVLVAVYDGFARFQGLIWEPPRYRAVRKLPFIPLESEIDQLISACGKKLATFLQLLKETGMRCGEASKLLWIDIDVERRLVTVTPEKHSDSRILPISKKFVGMLENIPKKSERVFSGTLASMKSNMFTTRKKVARRLGNPRLLKISFHTLRHWKATMEYHKTRDLPHVQKVMGHRDIKSTMLYVNLENALFLNANDEFHVKTAKNVDEACKLLEVGFEYVAVIDGVQVFRKRK